MELDSKDAQGRLCDCVTEDARSFSVSCGGEEQVEKENTVATG